MLNRILIPTGTSQTAVITALALLLVAAALLVFLQSPAAAQGNDRAVGGVTLTSPNPGELVITWNTPGNAPDDYRVTWKKSDGRWHSYKNANTVEGGNAFPTGTSHTVTGLEEGTAYQARVRARYFNDNGDLEKSGPWSDAVEITISATPSQDGEGDSNEGPSSSPPAKPDGLITAASHDSVLLAWDNPDDDTTTGYQVLRGEDADNLAVLTDDTGDANTSYTDSTVEAETTYVYAVRGRNAEGLGPQSDPVSVTTPAAPPAKPTGLITAARHDNVLLAWDNPDDDSITGYQVLRGEDADNLAILTDDTDSTSASYTDSTVEAKTTYVYAVRGRNARGLGPQSDPVTLTTSAAPEEDDPPTSARALAGEEFTLDGEELDTDDANCLEDTIGDVIDDCTINIDTTTAIFAVDGTLDSNDRLSIKIGRDKAAVDAASNAVDASDLVGADAEATMTFQVGRNLMRLWGDEDGSGGSSSEEHFYRVNVLPYWELNGDRLSKSDDCRAATDRTAAEITDADCIVTQFGNTATIRFHNVIKEQFNVYVHVNGTEIISEPGNTDLAGPFTLDLQDADNVVRVRLASKTGTHFAEDYGTDKFHYKVKATDVLVSNLGQTFGGGSSSVTATNPGAAVQFTTGSETDGYRISQVRLNISTASAATATVPRVSIYSDNSGQPGSSLKILTNPDDISTTQAERDFGADNYKLDPSTPYWIVVERASGSGFISVRTTGLTAEDTGSAAGWSIGDNASLLSSSGTWSTLTGIVRIPVIAVKGTVAPAVSDDATLSDLALTDASDNAIAALSPSFASDTTSYSATVANSVSQITVAPTANDSNADIEYLDDSDATLTDADTNTAVFDFDLDVGPNVVKVKVTAEDGTTTETYTVRIRRAEADLLVSNLGQYSNAGICISTPNTGLATQFTTGSETDGYLITQVRLNIDAESGTIPGVSIYSDSSGQPGSSLKILTNPGAVTTTRTEHDFGADNYKLDPSTSYWIVIERASGSGTICVLFTRTYTAEDTGSAAGWSIGDNGSGLSSSGTWSTSTRIHLIAVRGTVAPAVSDDATLSALALTDASNNAVALSPAFASATTSYSATVADSVSQIKVQPTANDSNADIEYLDNNDATLTDADTSTAVFDFDLDVGDNVVQVKVTAEDSATTETYTITVTRVDFLVSNAGSLVDDASLAVYLGASGSVAGHDRVAIQFTTGNHPSGYEVDTVRLRIYATAGTTPRVSIYSDNSGEPGASLKTLANPSAVPTSFAWADFGAGHFKLDHSTLYWIVVERASGSGDALVETTESTAEDAGTAEGWSIGNQAQRRTFPSGTWTTIGTFKFIFQMVIRGEEADASTDATLSALALFDFNSDGVTLSPAFAADVTSYTAAVANAHTDGKLEATPNDSNATVEFLDENNATITTVTQTGNVHSILPNFEVGENVFKVKVTARDGTTSRTYTITVTRVDFLVSNLGQTEGGTHGLRSDGVGSAVQFMTGSNTLGYNISKVRLKLGSPAGIEPRVSIYSDDSGLRPGSLLKVLINPTVIPTSLSVIEFDAEDYALDADTTYWVAVERGPGTGDINVSYTNSTDEDPGSAAGWSTGDFHALKSGGAWVSTNFPPIQVAILGTADTTPNNLPTGKPTISGTPESGQTLTPSTANIRDADGISNPRYVYSWIRVDGGTEALVQSSSSPNYLLTDDDVGKKIKVAVRYFDDGGRNERVESNLYPSSGNIRNKPNSPPTGSPTITGQAEVGHSLIASTSGIGDSDGLTNPGFTYRWQRQDGGVFTDITGATGMLYRLGTGDEDKRVRVRVTFTDDDGNRHSLTSAPTGTVQAQASIPSDKVEVSLGQTAYSVEEGDTLQVTVTLAEAPDDDTSVIIPFTLTPAGGATKADFRAKSSYSRHVRFDAGETTDEINISAVDDTLDDDDEYLTLCLGDLPEPYAVLVGKDCARIVIVDNDDPNSVEVAFGSRNYYASEDGNPAWPRITVYPVPDREITIPITFTRGGGLSAADHSTVTTSVTFGPGLYGEHGDGHLSDNRTYASFPIEIWAIDDSEDDDGEYMDLAFGNLPPFVSQETTNYRGYTESRVWFHDNDFTEVAVTNRPNKLETPTTVTTPGAPASLTATRGNTEVDLRWTPPASDGGAAITKYQYRVSTDGGTNWAPDWTDVPDGSDAGSDLDDERTVTATNLTNRTKYTFQVRAVNSEGSGSEIEATATPTANPRRLWVSFADAELEASEGDFEYGKVATVRVRLARLRDMEREVEIPINVEWMGGATRADTSTYTSIPSTITFKPGQTEQTFRVAARDDSVDDDGEWLKLSFGKLPERVLTGETTTTRIDLIDDDDPPVQVSFAQSSYEAAITSRKKCCVYAQLDVNVKLSAAPERYVNAGIVAESISGGSDIYLAYAAYIPSGPPYVGAQFYADETEFTVTVVMSAVGEEFDADQAYRLRFVGMSDRVSVGSPGTATITINANP